MDIGQWKKRVKGVAGVSQQQEKAAVPRGAGLSVQLQQSSKQ